MFLQLWGAQKIKQVIQFFNIFHFPYYFQLLRLFPFFLSSLIPFASCCFAFPWKCKCREHSATREPDFFLYIFIYFDVFIFSFLSSQELSCLQSFANSLTVPWEGLCLCCTFLPALPDPLGTDFSLPVNSSAASWAWQKIWGETWVRMGQVSCAAVHQRSRFGGWGSPEAPGLPEELWVHIRVGFSGKSRSWVGF